MDSQNRERYSRHILLEQFGEVGQEKLARSRITIVGCGALGSLGAERLCRGGIGELQLVDGDCVSLSNLPRQTLFTEEDAKEKRAKAATLAERLGKINSSCHIESHEIFLNENNAEEFLSGSHVVLDGSDSFGVRYYVINRVCIRLGIPWVYAGILGTTGSVCSILTGNTPCLRCIFPQTPEETGPNSVLEVGVLSTAVALASAVQVTEVLKILLEDESKRHPELFSFDIWSGRYSILDLSRAKNDDCPDCGKGRKSCKS